MPSHQPITSPSQIAVPQEKDRHIKIYHSCDSAGTVKLHHFKAGKYTIYHPELDPHASAPDVLIPKGNGRTERVQRCKKPRCDTCANTDVFTDLTMNVAKSHGIRRAALKPDPKAVKPDEKLADGLARGQWIYGDLKEGELVMKVSSEPKCNTFRDRSGSILRWLKAIPPELEQANSLVNHEVNPISIQLQEADALAMGAEHGNFQDSQETAKRPYRTESHLRTGLPAPHWPAGNVSLKFRPSDVLHRQVISIHSGTTDTPRMQPPERPQRWSGARNTQAHDIVKQTNHQQEANQSLSKMQRNVASPCATYGFGAGATSSGYRAYSPYSPRLVLQPEQLPTPPSAPQPLWPTLAADPFVACVWPPTGCQVGGYSVGRGQDFSANQLNFSTPRLVKVVGAASPGTKRTCEDAGWAVQERRKRPCRQRIARLKEVGRRSLCKRALVREVAVPEEHYISHNFFYWLRPVFMLPFMLPSVSQTNGNVEEK
ncbi:hypothetical protein LTR17_011053 [Elasticomyces elasticus]|nr:hypothetical protein LTR17_011053 [Elasticomyces elasticus]